MTRVQQVKNHLGHWGFFLYPSKKPKINRKKEKTQVTQVK